MQVPFPELKYILEDYNKIMHESQSKAIFVRGIEFQKNQIKIIDTLIKKLDKQKYESVAKKMKRNQIFYCA